MVGIAVLQAYTLYWSKATFCSYCWCYDTKKISTLKRYMHFVDNNAFTNINDKLFKIQLVINSLRIQCLKIEPEESHLIDEQDIPSKTRYTKIRQYNPKKPQKWAFKNLVRAGAFRLMYNFYNYSGKNEATDERDNRTAGCPLMSNKVIEKEGRGALDYRFDNNSGIIIVKWVDNSTVQLTSNFIGVEPLSTIKRGSKTKRDQTNVPCPQIVKSYNESMGGVDLVDMLISLYRIKVGTRRWYIKIFWHLVDVAKVKGCNLYRRHQDQHCVPKRSQIPLKCFSLYLTESLIKHNHVDFNAVTGRPAKRNSMEPISGRKPATATPYDDSKYDQVGHWPIPSEIKQRCRVCKAYVQIQCEKCKIYSCLVANRNCFRDFHFKK
ncbi:piggyBac transposable element-derived protein 2-like [Hydra vulgaris]|uniref:PiggyBac transposable element-derived protein 2-like n=1 Tax=Hydra vulgaris TaxID=6087 RepID=A0ABM4CAX4_HYDVU